MDRRQILASFAGVTGAAAFAGSALAAPMAAAALEHAKNTGNAGMISLEMATLALKKAHTPKIAEFAKLEHDEQVTVAEILKSMDPKLVPAPGAAMLAKVKKLGELSGAAFDKMFVADQIEGHEMLLKYQNEYLSTATGEGKYVTMLVRGMINEHLVLLSDLHKMVG